MELDIRKLIAGGVLAGTLVLGGVTIAGAREAPEGSTTTTAPADEPAAEDATSERDADREGCDKGEDEPTAL